MSETLLWLALGVAGAEATGVTNFVPDGQSDPSSGQSGPIVVPTGDSPNLSGLRAQLDGLGDDVSTAKQSAQLATQLATLRQQDSGPSSELLALLGQQGSGGSGGAPDVPQLPAWVRNGEAPPWLRDDPGGSGGDGGGDGGSGDSSGSTRSGGTPTAGDDYDPQQDYNGAGSEYVAGGAEVFEEAGSTATDVAGWFTDFRDADKFSWSDDLDEMNEPGNNPLPYVKNEESGSGAVFDREKIQTDLGRVTPGAQTVAIADAAGDTGAVRSISRQFDDEEGGGFVDEAGKQLKGVLGL